MDVRCKNCDKPFRIPDERFTGKGLKFTCTRCKEYVTISNEEFEHYSLSKTAVAALDLFETQPNPVQEPSNQDKEGTSSEGQLSAAQPVQVSEPEPEPMAVRCGSCDKLFRVPQAKIAGKGIKFACTRCGEYIKVTREDFDQHVLSKTAELFSASSVSTAGPVQQPQKAEPEAPQDKGQVFSSGPLDLDLLPQKTPVAAAEETMPPMDQPEPQPVPEPDPQPISEPEPQPESEPQPVPESESVKSSIPMVIPANPPEERKVRGEALPEAPARKTSSRMHAETAPKMLPPASFSSVEILILLVLLCVVFYGGYYYFKAPREQAAKPTAAVPIVETLQIRNLTNARDALNDIIISGTLDNASDKEKTAWYVVVQVRNAQDQVLETLRYLNGKQLYSRRDYEILEKRGVNVRELKAKNLEEQGVVIPAKGSVPLTIRYVQPPEGIASLNALVQPYDPVRLFKEIAEDNR